MSRLLRLHANDDRAWHNIGRTGVREIGPHLHAGLAKLAWHPGGWNSGPRSVARIKLACKDEKEKLLNDKSTNSMMCAT